MKKAISVLIKVNKTAAVAALVTLVLLSSMCAQSAPVGPVLTLTPGLVSTVAGNGTGGFGGDGGQALAAQLNSPMGITRDSAGNYYIADFSNNAVRKVAVNGTITTVAGNETFGYSGDGGPATSAQLSFPSSVAVDAAGNLYIADFFNNCVRKVNAGGTISTFATLPPGTLVRGVATDNSGNVYFSGWLEGVWKADSLGSTTRVAGNGTPGFAGDGGPATEAQTSGVAGLAIDSQGNLYLAEVLNSDVRKVDTNGVITTVAGNQQAGFSGDGGPATSAQFNGPTDIQVDAAGNLYIVDSSNNRIRKVDVNGNVSTIAGSNYGYAGDGGLATNGWFAGPVGIELLPNGNLLIGDTSNAVVRQVRVDTTTLVFGSVIMGQTSTAIRVLVSNIGSGDLHVSSVVASSGFGVQTTCSTVAVGSTCTADVTFSPSAVGSITGTVTFTDDAVGTPHIINVSGQGLPVPPATHLGFGRQFPTQQLNGNLGSVPVDALDAQGNVATGFSGAVALKLQGPTGFQTVNLQSNASVGVAAFDLSAAALSVGGTYTITASSSGLTSTQAQFSVTGAKDFSVSSAGSLTITTGNSGAVNVTVTPINGFAGGITLSCSGLPSHSTCSFSPASVNADGSNTPLPSVMTISTGVASAASHRSDSPIMLASGAGFISMGMLGLVFAPRRRRVAACQGGRARLLGLVILAVALLTTMVGCQGIQNGNGPLTPRGTYTVTVNATSNNLTHSSPVTLTVK